ncbi:hypothetical protein ACTU45_31370, partial [Streptomyces sp. 24-1644]
MAGGAVALLLTMGGVTALSAAAATAVPQRVTSYAFTSEEGDWVGGGVPGNYRAPADEIVVTGPASNVQVSVPDEEGGWDINLTAPAGHPALFPGVYKDPGSTVGRVPNLAVSGHHRACNVTYGSFSVNQIETDASGEVTV